MAEAHSEHKGELPLVVATELVDGEYAIIRIQLPVNFDFEKQGAKLLRNLKSAVNLFFMPEGEK